MQKIGAMVFEKICSLDDVWEGEMGSFETTAGQEVLVVCLRGGVKVYQAICPHQQVNLVEGSLKDGILTCKAHMWQFSLQTGEGVNPTDCHLSEYPVEIRGDDVYISVEGVVPYKSHT